MVTVYFDPSKERPFKREGGRVFILQNGNEVALALGSNTFTEEVLEELEKDTTFKGLVESEAAIIRKGEESTQTELQPVPQFAAASENPQLPATPVDPETIATGKPAIPPTVSDFSPGTAKTVKPLR